MKTKLTPFLRCPKPQLASTLHLRDDTPLDPAKILKLVQEKRSPYKLSPDMKLTRRAKDGEGFASGLDAADKLLAELSACYKDG